MSNAATIINQISNFLDKFSLKTNKLTSEDLIKFIEEKWAEADNEKYNIHWGSIIIGRMTNEYIWAKDFENMMRWLKIADLHLSFNKNPTYIRNYYAGQCCLECGNEEKALEYFNLCYSEDPEYIFTRAPFCYEFFNKHLEYPRELNINNNADDSEVNHIIHLPYWQKFFKEENKEIHFTILKNNFRATNKLNKKHLKGLKYLQDNQEFILNSILSDLLERYSALQIRYNYPEKDKNDFMPDIVDIYGFSDLLSIETIYLTSVYQDDVPYIGFLFSCSWDSEHSLGIMTHKNNIINVGDAETAFLI